METWESAGVGWASGRRRWKGENVARNNFKKWLVALACAGIPLVTTATCDPRTGGLDFFRDDDGYDDGYYYDGGYYVDYYDDCFFFDCW